MKLYCSKMAKRLKKQNLTIKNPETQAVIGVIFLVLAVLLSLSLFIDSLILNIVKRSLGIGVVVLAVICLAVGLRLLGSKSQFNSLRVIISLAFFGLIFLTWIHLFVPEEIALEAADTGKYGGIVGYTISRWFSDIFSPVGGLIILTPFLIITLGSTLSLTPSQIGKGIITGTTYFANGVIWFFTNVKRFINWLMGRKEEVKLKVEKNSKGALKMVPDIVGAVREEEEKEAEKVVSDQKTTKHLQISTLTQTKTIQPKAHLLYPNWKLPPLSLLEKPSMLSTPPQNIAKNADIIEETFENFGIRVRVVGKSQGPTVTQYMLAIPAGTKVSKIEALAKDLTLALAAPTQIRIVAPIPGTPYIGIEVANSKPQWVSLRELLDADEFKNSAIKIPIAIGKDVFGKCVIKDLQKMPHVLIAGATGSGKSVLVHGIIMSLLFRFSPDELRMLMVDPKMVELYGYNGIPHLLTPVITDMSEVLNSLKWVLSEMERRYRTFKEAGAKNIDIYNEKMGFHALPYIIIIIDEMADLMLRHGIEVENATVRLAQMARATGIHLVLATQRPSVDVITGLIKANIPARIAMAVTSIVDSRVILDQQGAETLLGRGDLLLKLPEEVKPIRIQAVYSKDDEIERVLNFIKSQTDTLYYNEEITEEKEGKITTSGYLFQDELFEDAVRVIVNAQRGSASLLQTKLGIGYARASRLIDELEQAGVVGLPDGNKPRKVLIRDADGFLKSFHGNIPRKADSVDNITHPSDIPSTSQNNLEIR